MDHQTISKAETDQFWKENRNSLEVSMRIFLAVGLIALPIAAIADWIAYPDKRIPFLMAKLFCMSMLIAFYCMSRSRWGIKYLEINFIMGSLLVASTFVFHAVIVNEPIIMRLTLIFMVIVAGTLMSWRLVYQVILVALSIAIFLTCSILNKDFPDPSLEPETMGPIVLLGITIILSYYTSKRRFDLWKTETALRTSEKQLQKQAETTRLALTETKAKEQEITQLIRSSRRLIHHSILMK
jgi:hypothetical protein